MSIDFNHAADSSKPYIYVTLLSVLPSLKECDMCHNILEMVSEHYIVQTANNVHSTWLE